MLKSLTLQKHPSFLFRTWRNILNQEKKTSTVACVAGVIVEGEGELGSEKKMRGIGERGDGTPAARTPFASFPPNDFQLVQLPYPLITVISSANENQARVSLHD